MNSIDTLKKISILFVVNETFPDAYGGVQTYIYEVARGLVQRGHKVLIVARKVNAAHLDTETIDGISIHRYESKKYPFYFLNQLSSIIKMRQIFRELCKIHKFDLINLHSPQAALGVNLSREAKKIPKVYTFHSLLAEEESCDISFNSYRWGNWRKYIKPIWFPIYLFFSRWLEKTAIDSSSKIISLSEFMANNLVKTHNIPETKIVKIAAGVNSEKFKPLQDKNVVRAMLGLPREKLIIFTVRRLVPRMGLDNLIKAMPFVLKRHPDAFLIIGGKGPLYPELKVLIDKLSLKEKVILAGFIPEDKLPSYYQASDLFILPSKTLEGFGIVTLEALACGIPVLATPVGGTIEILSKLDKRLLFKDTSVESIARLITEYLGEEQGYSEIQKQCRQFVLDNYSWEKTALETERVFLNILKGF
jgi:glycosyltransferase involved in cell wall biosynthesis